MGLFGKILKTAGAADKQRLRAEEAEPQAIEPQADEPQATEPHADKPQAIEPQADEPQATEPQAAEPQAIEPQADEPHVIEPPQVDEAEPQAIEPQAAEPQATEPEAPESKASKPETPKPKTAKSKSGKSKSSKKKAAKSKASEAPVVELLPASEWSDAEQSLDVAGEQAMSAPSLENAIVTKARDLSRLSREDLLQLLLTQSKDAERLQDYLRDVADEFERYTSLNERLRKKLDAKDEQIERLKGRLDDKDKRIASMQTQLDELEVLKQEEDRRSQIIVSAVEGVRGALEAFNVTADWHISSLRGLSEELDSQSVRAATLGQELATELPNHQEADMHGASRLSTSPGGNSKAADA